MSLPLAPEPDRLFRLVRQGVPAFGVLVLLSLAALHPTLRGWYLLGAVGAFTQLVPTLYRRDRYLRHRLSVIRWDGRWARAFRPLLRVLGMEAAWLRAFCAWNNRRVREAFTLKPARNAMVLLPHCIQMARCKADVPTRLDACYSCGKCPVGDVLEATLTQNWVVRLSNRSHKAYQEARALQPDLIVAVSCLDRLLKGLTKLPEIPSYVIALDLPQGMCVDTTFHVPHLLAAMEHLVAPRKSPRIVQFTAEDQVG